MSKQREPEFCPECGFVLESEEEKSPRSVPQLRRYFKGLRLMWQQWPESHPHQFGSPEELRAYLQMRAGYRKVHAAIDMEKVPKDEARMLVEAMISGVGGYILPEMQGSTMVLYRPVSVSFRQMGHKLFCEACDAVDAVCYAETGLTFDQLLKEERTTA